MRDISGVFDIIREQRKNIIRRFRILSVIMAKNFYGLFNEKEIALFVILAFLIMESSGSAYISSTQLHEVGCADSGAIITEQEIILAMPY